VTLVLVMTVIVTIAVVILVIPMAFVQPPASSFVVIVRVVPVAPFIGWVVPAAGNPAVVMSLGRPIAGDPREAGARRIGAPFITKSRWWDSDINRDLSRGR
jgi:hypothetical protein